MHFVRWESKYEKPLTSQISSTGRRYHRVIIINMHINWAISSIIKYIKQKLCVFWFYCKMCLQQNMSLHYIFRLSLMRVPFSGSQYLVYHFCHYLLTLMSLETHILLFYGNCTQLFITYLMAVPLTKLLFDFRRHYILCTSNMD